ncbi:MAG: flagellin FliC [Candidatus Hydrogenedentes bacterium]|nr:flagellin FliC [Candidatus Hydrogenedentota bacterium]
MGLNINTNLPAIQGAGQARRADRALSNILAQLATQRRINRAADDAAGLAIAERFNTQIRQGQAEINNLQTGINVTQTAEGGLSVQQDAVQRIRELAVQAQNGTLSDENRAALNQEAQQLLEQINSVASDTEFNGQNLLDQDTNINLGTEGGNEINIQQSNTQALGLDGLDISTAAGAQAALGAADTALTSITNNRATIGAQQNRFESAINQREIAVVNQREAESSIRDLDLARASIEQTRNQLLLRGAIGTLAQANVTPQSALRLLGN